MRDPLATPDFAPIADSGLKTYGFTGWLLLGGNQILITLLALAAVWRETPEFWRNAGGYPVLLRECVYFGFYPLMTLTGLLCLGTAATLLSYRTHAPLRARWGLLLVLVQSLLLCGVLLVALDNNFTNILEGRPVHWRAQ